MQIPSRFTIAVHLLVATDYFSPCHKVTSEFLSASVNVNPVVVRKILAQLEKAGLITITQGTAGIHFTRSLRKITLLDIYQAVEATPAQGLFHFHDQPNPQCPVGKNIHPLLDQKLTAAQAALEHSLQKTTLFDLCRQMKHLASS